MSNKQPKALRLADQLKERYGAMVPTSQAAAELRRLHALNAQMLEALRGVDDDMRSEFGTGFDYSLVTAAIAAATGGES
jgi:hypothetical protein